MLRLLVPALVALAALLAGCGQGASTPAQSRATRAPATEALPAATAPLTTAPTAAATATIAAAAPTAAEPAPAAAGPFAGLAQGVTPEGYHTLGSPDAPVTLVMYSDFL
jgi:hypothetical protein